MATKTRTSLSLAFSAAAALALLGGCKDEPKAPPASQSPAAPATQPAPATPAATQPGAAAPKGNDDHPNQIVLGETTAGGLKFRALQDEPVKPGGEGAFDLQITGYPAGGKPKAVRFWVGNEVAESKAKAEEEKPDNWHVHTEVPNPIPPGSKFWAEIEPASGEKFKVSFDFKKTP
jgi:hypothetical protein